MAAQTVNITLEQGATFRMSFTWREGTADNPGAPVNLTGATLRMQIRAAQGSPVLAQASSGDGLEHGGVDGTIRIVLPPSKTNLVTAAKAVYDLEAVYSPDDVHRVIQGRVTTKGNITQESGDPVLTP